MPMPRVRYSKYTMNFMLIYEGQPIRLISIPSGPSSRPTRNAFDYVTPAPRSLADRITERSGRTRSMSPARHSDVSGPIPANVDRYVPGHRTRSRSPMPRRREGRPPGLRRERGERGDRRGRPGRGESRGGRGGDRLAKDGRPKKTQEELDAEVEDYWGAKETVNETAAPVASTAQEDDIAMIE